MPKAKSECIYCHKKFKSLTMHTRFCPELKLAQEKKPEVGAQMETTAVSTAAYVKSDFEYQQRRAKEMLIELIDSLARINNAVASIFGEWRS